MNQTETKLNIKYPSLGLEQTDYPKNINAVLQCLSHILELAEGILELGYKEKSHVSSLITNISKEKVRDNINDLNKTRYINYINKYNLY